MCVARADPRRTWTKAAFLFYMSRFTVSCLKSSKSSDSTTVSSTRHATVNSFAETIALQKISSQRAPCPVEYINITRFALTKYTSIKHVVVRVCSHMGGGRQQADYISWMIVRRRRTWRVWRLECRSRGTEKRNCASEYRLTRARQDWTFRYVLCIAKRHTIEIVRVLSVARTFDAIRSRLVTCWLCYCVISGQTFTVTARPSMELCALFV